MGAVVLLNAVMGYLRAESAIAALEQMAAAHAHVIRDGVATTIPSADVVRGDILVIEEGDAAAADARVIASTALSMAEAPLTGESLPVAKDVDTISADAALGDRTNMIYSGTSATYGRGQAWSWRRVCERKWGASPACSGACPPSTRRCRTSSITSVSGSASSSS